MSIADQMRASGHRVCVVSSGAVGMGCQTLKLGKRPNDLAKKQALAAVGQGALLRLYTDLCASLSMVRHSGYA
jgi:glutamate 5-kinase